MSPTVSDGTHYLTRGNESKTEEEEAGIWGKITWLPGKEHSSHEIRNTPSLQGQELFIGDSNSRTS